MDKIIISWDKVDKDYSVMVDGDPELYSACNINFLQKYFGLTKSDDIIILRIHDKGEHSLLALYDDDGYVLHKKEGSLNLYKKQECGVFINDELVTNDESVLDFLNDTFGIEYTGLNFRFDLYTV